MPSAVPELERIRLDADAVASAAPRRGARRFAATDRAVLLGTQMVAKGHHFAGVSLAAVVDADTRLGLPDFRAEERTFQLLTQLAGRSGRDAPGRVIVQTFQPDARAVELAARHDVAGFSRASSSAGASSATRLSATSSGSSSRAPTPEQPLQRARGARAEVPGGRVLGPAPLLRLRGRYRAQLIAKTDRAAARRRARGAAARRGGSGDAPRRAYRGRRRRPTEPLGGFDETGAVPSGRAGRRDAASSVAPVSTGYEALPASLPRTTHRTPTTRPVSPNPPSRPD